MGAHAVPHLPSTLTVQEQRVLLLVADGMSNAEIAARLFVSVARSASTSRTPTASSACTTGWPRSWPWRGSGRSPRAATRGSRNSPEGECRTPLRRQNTRGTTPVERHPHDVTPSRSARARDQPPRRAAPRRRHPRAHRRPRRPTVRRTDDHVRPRVARRDGRRLAAHRHPHDLPEGAPAPPVGGPYLAFTSQAVHDAARRSHGTAAGRRDGRGGDRGPRRPGALLPGVDAALDADLATTMATLPDGPSRATARAAIGTAIGAAAPRMIALARRRRARRSHRSSTRRHAAPGVWPASGPGGMSAPWLGFVDPRHRRRAGRPQRSRRPDQPRLRQGLRRGAPARLRHLHRAHRAADGHRPLLRAQRRGDLPRRTLPPPRRRAARPAGDHPPVRPHRRARSPRPSSRPGGSSSTSASGAPTRPSPEPRPTATTRPRPSGLGAARAQPGVLRLHVRARRRHLPLRRGRPPDARRRHAPGPAGGSDPTTGVVVERSYATLTALEHDALHARIWGGLHFRDAMRDGYRLGHTTARRVHEGAALTDRSILRAVWISHPRPPSRRRYLVGETRA